LLVIAVFFAATFLVVKSTGILSIEQIKNWLTIAQQITPIYVALIVVALLFLDLFIAIPTLTVLLLSGHFIGFVYAATAASIGVMLVASCGYAISFYFGDSILKLLLKNNAERNEAVKNFQEHGFVMILLSRAMPILPEVTTCLAGITKMPFGQFISAWLISSIPYILIATYAGSISSLGDPKPAIFAAIGMSVFLYTGWYFFHRKIKK